MKSTELLITATLFAFILLGSTRIVNAISKSLAQASFIEDQDALLAKLASPSSLKKQLAFTLSSINWPMLLDPNNKFTPTITNDWQNLLGCLSANNSTLGCVAWKPSAVGTLYTVYSNTLLFSPDGALILGSANVPPPQKAFYNRSGTRCFNPGPDCNWEAQIALQVRCPFQNKIITTQMCTQINSVEVTISLLSTVKWAGNNSLGYINPGTIVTKTLSIPAGEILAQGTLALCADTVSTVFQGFNVDGSSNCARPPSPLSVYTGLRLCPQGTTLIGIEYDKALLGCQDSKGAVTWTR